MGIHSENNIATESEVDKNPEGITRRRAVVGGIVLAVGTVGTIASTDNSIRRWVSSIIGDVGGSTSYFVDGATRQIDELMGPSLENLPPLVDPELADATNYPYLNLHKPSEVLRNP